MSEIKEKIKKKDTNNNLKKGQKKERNIEDEKRTIFVGNLPKDTKKEVIKNFKNKIKIYKSNQFIIFSLLGSTETV